MAFWLQARLNPEVRRIATLYTVATAVAAGISHFFLSLSALVIIFLSQLVLLVAGTYLLQSRCRRRIARASVAIALLLGYIPCVVFFRTSLLGLDLFYVPSGSMNPAIPLHSVILVDIWRPPELCDAAVFEQGGTVYVKRIIGMPGERLSYSGSWVFKNNAQWDCPVGIRHSSATDTTSETVKLVGDQWFLMGDNRPFSTDSRRFGPINTEQIIGVVVEIWKP